GAPPAETAVPAAEVPIEPAGYEEVRAPEPVGAAEAPPPLPPLPPSEQLSVPDRGPEIARLQGRVRRWRKVSLWLFLIAAAAAGIGALREMHPEYFPAELRPKMKTLEITKTVEIPSPKPAQFVAVLEKDGAQPAFLVP